jgi:hypothetical protein
MDARRECLFLMHGMKRSGNHAIINWLLPQLDCVHFNNLIPLGPILRGRPMPISEPFAAWRHAQEQRIGTPLRRLLVSLEDHDLGTMPFTDVDVPIRRLLVLRNPRQLFASRLRKAFRVDMPAYPRRAGPILQRAVALWKQHARCYLGEHAAFPGRIAVSYDSWFADVDYRRAISAALGTTFVDAGFGKVSAEGGGSSFDGTGFDGRGHLMSVGDRDASLEPHERELLDQVFGDDELRELDRQFVNADPYRRLLCRGVAIDG